MSLTNINESVYLPSELIERRVQFHQNAHLYGDPCVDIHVYLIFVINVKQTGVFIELIYFSL